MDDEKIHESYLLIYFSLTFDRKLQNYIFTSLFCFIYLYVYLRMVNSFTGLLYSFHGGTISYCVGYPLISSLTHSVNP